MVEQTIVHYATDGWLLHKGSEEAKRQLDMEKMEQEASQRFQVSVLHCRAGPSVNQPKMGCNQAHKQAAAWPWLDADTITTAQYSAILGLWGVC
jgi:hypothetical protein